MKKVLLSLSLAFGLANFAYADEIILNTKDIPKDYLTLQQDKSYCEGIEVYVSNVNEKFFSWFREKNKISDSAKITVSPCGDICNVSECEQGDFRIVFYNYSQIKVVY